MTTTSPRRLAAAVATAILLAIGTLAVGQPAGAATSTMQLVAPTGLVVYPTDGGAVVQWSEPVLADGEYLDHYEVTSSPGGSTTTTNLSNVAVHGLTNGTAYTFTVRTVTIAGEVSPESEPSAPVTPATVPDAPTDVVANASGTGEVTVSWSPPARDGGAPVEEYWVSGDPDGGTAVSGDQTSAVLSGLSWGTAYAFTVVAINSAGWGSTSAASAPLTVLRVPTWPQNVTAAPGDRSATLTWWMQTAFPGVGVDSFTVTPSPDGDPVTVAADELNADALSVEVPGLVNGRAYTFTVTATNGAGDSQVSDPSEPVTPRTVPGAPTGVSATPENWRALVAWTAPASDGGAAVTQYTVTSSPGGRKTTFEANQRSGWVLGLTNGTPYTFTVTATNAAGRGQASQPSAPVTAHGSRADARIKVSTDAAYRGNDVYNTTGSGQSVSATARRGTVQTVQMSFQNDGKTTEMYRLKAPGSSPGFTVTYALGSTDVTDRVVQGRFSPGTGALRPGAAVVLTVRIRVARTAKVGSVKSLLVTDVCDSEPALSDAVKATVKVAS